MHSWRLNRKSKANFAEREGFEPPVPLSTAVFKTAVIDHSTTFPKKISQAQEMAYLPKAVQRYDLFSILQTIFRFFLN